MLARKPEESSTFRWCWPHRAIFNKIFMMKLTKYKQNVASYLGLSARLHLEFSGLILNKRRRPCAFYVMN